MATTLTTSYQRISTISVSYGEIRTYAKYNSQNIDNNTTTISLKTTYYLRQWISVDNGTSTLDGTSKSYRSTRFNAGETTLQEFTRTIYHNADGTSPNRNVATSWSASYGGGGSTSADVVAPKILRQATITSAPDFNDEQNPTIKYSNPAGNSVTTLRARIGSSVENVAYTGNKNLNKTGTSYTFNLTDEERTTLRNACANSNTLPVRFVLETIIGGTTLWSLVDKTMTIVNGNPTFSAAYQDTNSTTTAITNNNQKIIRNNSTLQINTTNLSAKKYATLSSIKTVINGVTYNGTISGTTATFNIGTLNVSSNTTAAVTLTDSRGLKTTHNLTIQVLDWELPSAIITAQRENNFYNPTTINVDSSYSSLDGLNTLSIQMRYKKTTDTDYGSYQTLQDDTPVTVQLDNNHEWNVQVLLTDRLGTKTYNVIVSRGMPIAFFDRIKRSLGVNKFPDNSETIEVNKNLIITDTSKNKVLDGNQIMTGCQLQEASSTESTSTGLYIKLCHISLKSHLQGRFAYFRIFIGDGNNGRDNQNAFIDLTLQQGWTGSENGRFGGTWELHSMKTSFNLTNTNIVVTSDSNLEYDVWFYTTKAYCKPWYLYSADKNTEITHIGNITQTSVPSGSDTSCNVSGTVAVESGSNSNSNYIKYVDGTMICYGKIDSSGQGFVTVTYPIAFTVAPTVTVSQMSDSETSAIVVTKTVNITETTFRVASVYSGGYTAQRVNWIAIGKWK